MCMNRLTQQTLVVAGPTASGKTSLGVQLAALLNGEILSADSRQVYRGLTIGAGKDLSEYFVNGKAIPYHLIDIADLTQEFSVFHYQQAFHKAFAEVVRRGHLPIVVGGTGLYIESVLSGYSLIPTPENPELREELSVLDDDVLAKRLRKVRNRLHNITDFTDRSRMIRAIEIAEYTKAHPECSVPAIPALVLVILYPPDVLRERIARRLAARIEAGLIEEVQNLHDTGVSWERLESLGLEYRFVAEYLQGKIKSSNDLFQKLCAAIAQFAKRQRTWFRGMERRGIKVHWIAESSLPLALDVIRRY